MIRFRAPANLKARLEKLAQQSEAGEDSSELARRALVVFLDAEEAASKRKKPKR